jgi:hypothetical protein
MGTDILLNNVIREPPYYYSSWALGSGDVIDIPGDVTKTSWSYTPVLSNPAFTGYASAALFACKKGGGCSKACPATFIITD